MLFFDYLNAQHPNISFTFEKQEDGKLPFLDILIDNSSNTCITSVFHKKTYTGLLTNFLSFTPFTYKIETLSLINLVNNILTNLNLIILSPFLIPQ
jgi:hypothetical protein